ncbi:Uncharacterised protein [uncultured archaeon]|nr:Uncharacterised protein [uncultured archaeon]
MNVKAVGSGMLSSVKNVMGRKVNATAGGSSMVVNAIKNVVRSDWEVSAKQGNVSIVLLNKIAEFMRNEMRSIDYEAICMRNIVANSKQMSKEDFHDYAYVLKALTKGYKVRFGPEFANLMLVGVTSVAKDPNSARKHLDNLVDNLYGKASVYDARLHKEIIKAGAMEVQLKSKESSIIARIFKKNEISRLKAGLDKSRCRTVRIESRKAECVSLASNLKNMATPNPFPSKA